MTALNVTNSSVQNVSVRHFMVILSTLNLEQLNEIVDT
jgi:hypothetical protein